AALLLLYAFRRGMMRDRLALLCAAGAAIATPVLLHAFVLRPIGWALQGRHVLPLFVVAPLIAGEIAARRTAALHRSRRAWVAAIAAVAAVQLVALYSDAHRSAVGVTGSWLFPLTAEWSPPSGWLLVLALGLCGACLILYGACSP